MQTRFPHTYVITVMADDQPGIIATVTGAIVALGGNVEACSQTVVEGYFTLIGVISLPEEVKPDRLATGIAETGGDTRLDVLARRYHPHTPAVETQPHQMFVMTAFGADAPGVLNRFSRYLTGKDINIVDFYADIRGDDLVLISQLEVPDRWDIAALQADLADVADEMGFTVRLQHENVFVATNQLRMELHR